MTSPDNKTTDEQASWLPRGVSRSALVQELERMRKVKVLVLGDFVLDEYLYGRTSRISREAPVLVVEVEDNEYRLGGAANVAANLVAMGADVTVASLLGDDDAGRIIQERCTNLGMDTSGLFTIGQRATPLKTRVLAGGVNTARQQMLRLDRGGGMVPEPENLQLLDFVERRAGDMDALVVSDYGLGTVSREAISLASSLTRRLVTIGDSRYSITKYKGFSAVTPNEPETADAVGMPVTGYEQAVAAGQALFESLDAAFILMKRGKKGMILFGKDASHCTIGPFGRDEVVDVTGAGDTVLAVFSIAMAAGMDPICAAALSNIAGGLVVLKAGAASVTAREMLNALEGTSS